jgi:endo-1,4-beta-xylanase
LLRQHGQYPSIDVGLGCGILIPGLDGLAAKRSDENRPPAELRSLMADHIRTVVGRYRGRIDAWDVVNEPLETTGSAVYENHFHQVLGPGYIAEAFELAHEADPEATLFLNEALVSSAGAKFDALYTLTEELLQQGAPVHGVGLQGHFLTKPPSREELQANLERQRQDFYDMAAACLAVPACARITFWGFTDKHTWIDDSCEPGLAPLPLDTECERKPAYFGLREGLLSGL